MNTMTAIKTAIAEKKRWPSRRLGCILSAGLGGFRDSAGASHVIESLRERENTEYVSPFEFVNIYNALGETDLAIQQLENAYQERTPRLSGELWDRPFDNLRSDPRVKDLIHRIGLPVER